MSVRSEIIETVNRLFIYTDNQAWDKLRKEIFSAKVYLDMSSMGGEAAETTSKAICEMWKEGFKDLDAVNHLAGNYLVETDGNEAAVFAYVTASHFRKAASNGTTREFVGTYDINMVLEATGWRIDRMKYTLKYMSGNANLD